MESFKKREGIFGIRSIAQIGVMSAVATVLMFFEFPLPFIPPFYKLDFSEIPVLIVSFAVGPLAGILTELVKVLLHILLKGSTTAGVGDFANFLIGCSFVVPAALIYRTGKTRVRALGGMVIGTAVMAIVGGLLNVFLLLPVYASAFHMPMEALVNMGTQVNPAINSVTTLVLLATTPLNLIKGVLVSMATFLLYKKVSPVLHTKH